MASLDSQEKKEHDKILVSVGHAELHRLADRIGLIKTRFMERNGC